VKVGRQLADFGALHRLELRLNQLAVDRIAEAAEDPVRRLARMSRDEDLRGQQFTLATRDLEVDMRRGAPRIRYRLDRAEAILALGIRLELAVSLEVLVLLVLLPAAVARVQVNRVGVALPDLDQRVADRFAGQAENPPGQMS